jgi:hypothetical protein
VGVPEIKKTRYTMRQRTGTWASWVAAAALAVSAVGCGDDGGSGTESADEGGSPDTSVEEGDDGAGEESDASGEGTPEGGGGADTTEGEPDAGGEGEPDAGDEGEPDAGDEGEPDGEEGEPDGEEGEPEPCPKEEGTCTVEVPEVFGKSMRVNSIQIGNGGKPGEALDVDNKGEKDCAPTGCEAGIDNALGVLSTLANGPLEESVNDGSVNIIAEVVGDPSTGAFTLQMYVGDPANAACVPTDEVCSYEVSMSSWACDCALLVSFDATLDGDDLVAGGDNAVFAFSLPLSGAVLDIAAYKARIEGKLTLDGDGNPTLENGVLGGAVRKADIIAAVEAIPDGVLPIPKGTVVGIVEGLVADVDTDGDGTDEALSIGLKIAGSPAVISGVQAEDAE